MESIFFDNAAGIWRTLVVGVCAYFALVIILRTSGKRTLAKMNAFDLVVTVALGSTLATILLSKDVALAEGVTALVLLCLLQYAVAWGSTRSRFVNRFAKSSPSVLFYDGRYLDEVMKRERVTAEEVRAAVRSSGGISMEEVRAVVLETDGTFSVLQADGAGSETALVDVVNHPLNLPERPRKA